jgi:hypothetical protein
MSSSDLSRFLRAVKTLAKLARQYSYEDFVEALGRWASVQEEGDVWFVGTSLDDIGRELADRRDGSDPHCRQCGGVIESNVRYDERKPRTDAHYCSPKCRQKAYRKRVTANAPKRKDKRNGNGVSLRLTRQKRELAVTEGGEPGGPA